MDVSDLWGLLLHAMSSGSMLKYASNLVQICQLRVTSALVIMQIYQAVSP